MSEKKKQWKILHNLCNALISHKEPVSLIYFVTEACNAKCPHCFVEFKSRENELSLFEIEKISESCGNSLRNIALTGGEPFLRDDLFDIAKIWWTNSTIQSVSVTTNGSMPDRVYDFAKKCTEEKIPVSFFFSYDFIGEKHSEYRRLNNLHENVLTSYHNVVDNFPIHTAALNITISKENYQSAEQTYRYMRDELKISNINCTLVRGDKADILSNDERKGVIEVYKNIRKQMDLDFDSGKIGGYTKKNLTHIALNAKNKMLWKYVSKTFVENKFISPCCAGSLFGIILSDGSVYPCELLKNSMGNLRDFDFDFLKCWYSDNAKSVRQSLSKCFCTFECSWMMNIFSSPRYYFELGFNVVKNLLKRGRN